MPEKDKEIEIQAQLRSIIPIVDTIARELSSHNFGYEVRATPKPEGTFVRYDVLIIEVGKIGVTEKRPIGAFTLHELEGNRTILTVLHPSRWCNGKLTPTEQAIAAYSGSEYDKLFSQFIKRLEDRLTHYRLNITLFRGLWKWVKSHKVLSTIGTALIIVITLLGTNWDTVVSNWGKCLSFIRSIF